MANKKLKAWAEKFLQKVAEKNIEYFS